MDYSLSGFTLICAGTCLVKSISKWFFKIKALEYRINFKFESIENVTVYDDTNKSKSSTLSETK